MKKLKIMKTKFKTGYWHGEDATILMSDRDGKAILVGSGYSLEELNEVYKMVKEDKPLGEWEDYVLYVDNEEWREQQ